MRRIRKLRHWKQRYNPNAQFIWRRDTTWGGSPVKAGDPIPEALQQNPAKLRRFWESQAIELAEFSEPNVLTGKAESNQVEPILPDYGLDPLVVTADPDDPDEDAPAEEYTMAQLVEMILEEGEIEVAEWNEMTENERKTHVDGMLQTLSEKLAGKEPDEEPDNGGESDESDDSSDSSDAAESEPSAHDESSEAVDPSDTAEDDSAEPVAEDLVTKETDRKWHVDFEDIHEVHTSKTKATARAQEILDVRKSADPLE